MQAIAAAILDVTSDKVLAQRLRTGGREEIGGIGWRRAASRMQHVYRRLSALRRAPLVGT